MTDTQFTIERARSYWRHAPSGAGKHDTSVLAAAPAAELLQTWDEAFRRRFAGYPEEMTFVRTFAPTVAGQRLLSVGSGLGLHEIYYQAHGATVTCADIVPSNLEVIRRVSQLKGIGEIRTILLDGGTTLPDATFDVVFIYGSLMAMPAADQRRMLSTAARVMAPGGRIVLMLYTWEFARRTCGWDSPDQFDPTVFARASDPTVGEEACPWSDWHDDAKLLSLAEPGFAVTRRQLWNDDLYIWYELRKAAPDAKAAPFFTEDEHYAGRVLQEFDAGRFQADQASASSVDGGREFVTTESQFSYAAVLPEAQAMPAANGVDVTLTLRDGAISVALLDAAKGEFVTSAVVTAIGRGRVRLLPRSFPQRYQIVISNHQADRPARSRVVIHSAALVAAELAEPPGH